MNPPYGTPDPQYDPRRATREVVLPVSDTIWTRRGLWASILLGAVVGFAATVFMGTFGAATGIVVSAAAADDAYDNDRSRYRDTQGRVNGSTDRTTREVTSRGGEPGARKRESLDRTDESRRPKTESNTHPSLGGSESPEKTMKGRDRTEVPAPTRSDETPPARVDEAKPDRPDTTAVTTEDERDTMKGAAIGGALWLILSAMVAGLIGGYVSGRFAHIYSNESSIVGVGTWAVGILIMVSLAAFGASGLLGGLGAGAGELLGNRSADVDAETGKAAAAAAGIATWGFLVAQLIGLGASILGASRGVKRRLRLYTEPERPGTYGTTTPVSPAMP
jgi:hypothetical protein